jgi:hypothetical protein
MKIFATFSQQQRARPGAQVFLQKQLHAQPQPAARHGRNGELFVAGIQ